LGLTEEEMKENERLWKEENGENLKAPADAGSAMRSVGVTPGGMSAEAEGQDAEATPDMAAAAEAGVAGAEQAQPAPAA
jgi:hypothetical protein